MFQNMSIGKKMYAGFGVVLVLIVLMFVGSFWGSRAVDEKITVITEDRIVKLNAAMEVSTALNNLFRYVQQAMLESSSDGKAAAKKGIEDSRAQYRAALEKIEKASANDPGAMALIKKLKDTIASGVKIVNKILELTFAGQDKEALALWNAEYAPKVLPTLMATLGEIVKYQQDRIKEAKADAEKTSHFMATLMIGVTSVVCVLSIFIVTFLVRDIRASIGRAVTAVGALAEGDLTQKIESGRTDEIGQLLSHLGTTIDNLKAMIGGIKTASDSMASASTEMSASVEQISRNMESQSNRANQIATSSEEMSQTVIDIARNAGDIANSAQNTLEVAHNGAQVVEKTVAEVRDISSTVDELAQTMAALGERSQQIGDILSVIRDIADQTNLLALNAAIEAARAGEQGRGFAVVADEVRKLAEKTAQSTAQIGGMITSIQTETASAVGKMDRCKQQVESGVQFANNAGHALGEIVSSVHNLQGMVQQIASATEEMSATAETISGDIQQIASGAKEISLGANQIAQGSSDIARLGEDLQGQVRKFKV